MRVLTKDIVCAPLSKTPLGTISSAKNSSFVGYKSLRGASFPHNGVRRENPVAVPLKPPCSNRGQQPLWPSSAKMAAIPKLPPDPNLKQGVKPFVVWPPNKSLCGHQNVGGKFLLFLTQGQYIAETPLNMFTPP